LIKLRKQLPLLTHGDYEDLLPNHPAQWCYRRSYQGKNLYVLANLSAQTQTLEISGELPKQGHVLMSNYPQQSAVPQSLRSYESIYWLVDA
jgi:trehalose-6-phosphate hydrolase